MVIQLKLKFKLLINQLSLKINLNLPKMKISHYNLQVCKKIPKNTLQTIVVNNFCNKILILMINTFWELKLLNNHKAWDPFHQIICLKVHLNNTIRKLFLKVINIMLILKIWKLIIMLTKLIKCKKNCKITCSLTKLKHINFKTINPKIIQIDTIMKI